MLLSRIRTYISLLLLVCLSFSLGGPINSSAAAIGFKVESSRFSTVSSNLEPSTLNLGLAPQASSPFGVAGVMRWPDWGTFARPCDVMLETGGSWVREDFVWGLIESKQGWQDWTATDRITQNVRDRGLNILGIIAYSVNWATPAKEDDGSADPVSVYPPDLNKYYTWVHTLVSRYKGKIGYWEVWNEPDNHLFWKPAPNAREYAEVLKTAYRAVKDADPNAKVLTGGLSGNAVPYLEEMFAAGAGNSFDILAIHPYAIPLDKAQGRIQSRPEVHKMLDVELNKYRAFLQRHNVGDRPLWVTEVGWPARDWGLDDQMQADYLAQAYALMLSGNIAQKIFYYGFKDATANPSDSWGLLAWGAGKTDLAPKRPSFLAYANSARHLTGTTPVGRVQLGAFNPIENFEEQGTWTRSTNPNGSFSIVTEQRRTGTSSGKLQYNFTGTNQAVDFAPPQPRPLPGRPTRLGLFVRGDASGNYISAWLKDRDGELFKVRLGAVTGAADGWRYFESRINNYYFDWEHAGGNPSNNKVDYPVSFVSFRLENTPDQPAGSGTIYLDDLQSFDGPDVTTVRFTRSDGQVVDVLWSVDPAQVNLPTSSARAQVSNRDGTLRVVDATGGALALTTGTSPIYVIHEPPKPAPVTTPSPPVEANAMCQAVTKAAPINNPATRYFAETGHNLSGAFKTYWEQHGGLFILGLPITEEFTAPSSDGKMYKQQYFERARAEYHPENAPPNDVQLGLLGNWVTGGRSFQRLSPIPSGQGVAYFGETGQSLRLFKDWWSRQGGLGVFGYPISGELQEKNAADGKTYTVQYFERNRLEHHPEQPNPDNSVMLGLLGVEYLAQQGCKVK